MSSASSGGGIKAEPDNQWKAQLKQSIGKELQVMVDEMKAEYNRQSSIAPHNLEGLKKAFDQDIRTLEALASEHFAAELNRERQERHWAVKLGTDAGSAEAEPMQLEQKKNPVVVATSGAQEATETARGTGEVIDTPPTHHDNPLTYAMLESKPPRSQSWRPNIRSNPRSQRHAMRSVRSPQIWDQPSLVDEVEEEDEVGEPTLLPDDLAPPSSRSDGHDTEIYSLNMATPVLNGMLQDDKPRYTKERNPFRRDPEKEEKQFKEWKRARRLLEEETRRLELQHRIQEVKRLRGQEAVQNRETEKEEKDRRSKKTKERRRTYLQYVASTLHDSDIQPRLESLTISNTPEISDDDDADKDLPDNASLIAPSITTMSDMTTVEPDPQSQLFADFLSDIKQCYASSQLEQSSSTEGLHRLRSLFKIIVFNKQLYKAMLRVVSDDAQVLLDSLQWVLDSPGLDIRKKNHFLKALLRLSSKSRLYPRSLILKDVMRLSEVAVACGHYGEIWRGSFHEQHVCMKIVKVYERSRIDPLLQAFAKEAILWSQLRHPNLLPFYGIYHFDDSYNKICLVSPWMDNGNIKDYLVSNPTANRLLLISDIANGIAHLHNQEIIHGDLKGLNILVSASGRACLADFGLSGIIDKDLLRWTTEQSAASPGGGTVRWQAPELLGGEEDSCHSKQSDVYAFSSVCYEVFTDQVPFHGLPYATVLLRVMNGRYPPRPKHRPGVSDIYIKRGLTDDIWMLMERCWRTEPTQRPSIDVILHELPILPSDERPHDDWSTLLSVSQIRT